MLIITKYLNSLKTCKFIVSHLWRPKDSLSRWNVGRAYSSVVQERSPAGDYCCFNSSASDTSSFFQVASSWSCLPSNFYHTAYRIPSGLLMRIHTMTPRASEPYRINFCVILTGLPSVPGPLLTRSHGLWQVQGIHYRRVMKARCQRSRHT